MGPHKMACMQTRHCGLEACRSSLPRLHESVTSFGSPGAGAHAWPARRYGEAGLKGSMGGGGGADMGGFNNPFDLFEQFFGASVGGRGGFGGGFGGMGGRTRAVQGEDEKYELVLDFTDAVFGSRRAARPGGKRGPVHAWLGACVAWCMRARHGAAADDMKYTAPDPATAWRPTCRNLG